MVINEIGNETSYIYEVCGFGNGVVVLRPDNNFSGRVRKRSETAIRLVSMRCQTAGKNEGGKKKVSIGWNGRKRIRSPYLSRVRADSVSLRT